MSYTLAGYQDIIEKSEAVFIKKNHDYGASWRLLRPISILDQLFIKANRIKTLSETNEQKVTGAGNSIEDEFKGIINYAAMGRIQFVKGAVTEVDEEADVIAPFKESLYLAQVHMQERIEETLASFEVLRYESFVDLILKKISRLKQVLDYADLSSKEVTNELLDIINFAIFSLIILNNKKK